MVNAVKKLLRYKFGPRFGPDWHRRLGQSKEREEMTARHEVWAMANGRMHVSESAPNDCYERRSNYY